MKTTAKQAKKQQKLPKDTYIGATVRLFDSYRDNLVRKLSVLYLKVQEDPNNDWSWLSSLLSNLGAEPFGFHGVAVDSAQLQKVYALWFKQFGCVRCRKGGIHHHQGVCIRCHGHWRKSLVREEETI